MTFSATLEQLLQADPNFKESMKSKINQKIQEEEERARKFREAAATIDVPLNAAPIKRGPGRPRKYPLPVETLKQAA